MVDLSIKFKSKIEKTNIGDFFEHNDGCAIFEAFLEDNIIVCNIGNAYFNIKATEFRKMIKLFDTYIRDIDEDDSDE